MKKLFFFDIDGTLIDCENGVYSILPDTELILNQLKEAGHDVFLATGRCKCFILDGVMKYPFNGYVTCNGAYVEYNNEAIYKKIVPIEAIKATRKLCIERHLAYFFEGNDFIYVLDKNDPKHKRFQTEWGMKGETIVDKYNIDEIETYIGMIVVNSKDDIKPMVEQLSPYFHIQRHQSGFSFDLTLKGESKAKGIKKLVEKMNYDMKDTIAFGDGRNDIEMIEEVGLGIAMGNAAIETKSIADYVTDCVDQQGIKKALEHFGYIRKR